MSLGLKDPKKKNKSIGFLFALNGIREVWKTERNFRIHVSCGGTAVIVGVILSIPPVEWALLILLISLVLSLEMINSSIERVMDYLAPEQHPLAGLIKDIAAGAVLISAIGSVLIALFLFIPKII